MPYGGVGKPTKLAGVQMGAVAGGDAAEPAQPAPKHTRRRNVCSGTRGIVGIDVMIGSRAEWSGNSDSIAITSGT